MLNCQDIELLLQDYLDGYLLPSQKEVLDAHILVCSSCRVLLSDFRRLDDEMDSMPQVEAPGGLSKRILSSLPEKTFTGPPWRRHVIALTGTLAATALVFIVGVLFSSRYGMQVQSPYREVEIIFSAPAAGSVAVVGDFNGWDAGRNLMTRYGNEGFWRARFELPPGIYQYGFIIDGRQWTKDPQAEGFLADGFGGENSVLFIEG